MRFKSNQSVLPQIRQEFTFFSHYFQISPNIVPHTKHFTHLCRWFNRKKHHHHHNCYVLCHNAGVSFNSNFQFRTRISSNNLIIPPYALPEQTEDGLYFKIYTKGKWKKKILKSIKTSDTFFSETSTCIFHKKNNWELPQHRKHIPNA